MEIKRILIAEDHELLRSKMDDLNKFLPAFNEMKHAFEALELGELTNDTYKALITSKDGVGVIMDSFFTELDITLKAAGLNKDSLRKVHVDHATAEFEKFIQSLKALKAVNPDPYSHRRFKGLKVENTSYIDGTFQVSAMDKEDILEKYCRTYLETDQEIKLHCILKNVRDSINEFNGYLDDLAKAHELSGAEALDFWGITKLSSLSQFLNDDKIKEINPKSIEWVSEMIVRAKSKKAIN